MQIFGTPFSVESTTSLVTYTALGMLLLIPIGVVIGFAHYARDVVD